MFNGGMYNGPQFNGSNYSVADALTYSPDQPFVLHLRNQSGTFLRKVEDFSEGTWSDKVNSPGSLKFTIPLDSDVAQTDDFTFPNRVWLYDSTLEKIGEFPIVKTKADAVKGTFGVECRGLLYLLTQELAPYRNVATAAFKAQARVVSVLANQDNTNPITLGYMAPKYRNLDITMGTSSNKTIWASLIDVWRQIGGIIKADNQGRLLWLEDELGDPFAPVMSLYDDITEYVEEVDTDSVVNRLYVQGNIGPGARVQVTGGSGYIEDATSQATYGIKAGRTSISASDQDELMAIANQQLAYMKDPRVTRKISAIDLARVQLDPDNPKTPHPEYMYAGGMLRVQPPSNIPGGTVFSAVITSVERSLSDFLDAKITISDKGTFPGDPLGRRLGGSSTEFFEILASEFEDLDDTNEISHEQDEDIWDYIEANVGTVESSGSEIQPVDTVAAVGTNTTKFAPSDHVHEGIPPLVYDESWTQQSDLGNPQKISFGYLDSGAGDDEGLWFYPPDGTTNADWKPVNHYA